MKLQHAEFSLASCRVAHAMCLAMTGGRANALFRLAVLPLLLLLVQPSPSFGDQGSTQHGRTTALQHGDLSFSVYALSTHAGVPEATREALEKVRGVLQSYREKEQALELSESVIGLEGERRICVEFRDAAAAEKAWREVQSISADVELISLKVELCSE